MLPDWITLNQQKEIVLVLCNYEFLWDKFIKEIKKTTKSIFQISLDSSNTNCHQAIKEQLESKQLTPDILLVSGLEKLSHTDSFIKSFNSDRPLIEKLNFSSYLLFRVTDQVKNQLRIKAPDFFQIIKTYSYTATQTELKKFMRKRIDETFSKFKYIGT